MKKIKRLVPLLLLALFGCCVTVSAGENKNSDLIQWKADESQVGAELIFTPDEEMFENAVTTLQLTMQIVDTGQKITDAAVEFMKARLRPTVSHPIHTGQT